MPTGSPSLLNHRPTDNLKTPAIFGTFISVPIVRSFFAFACQLRRHEDRNSSTGKHTPADSGKGRQGLAGGWREARGMVLGVAPRTCGQIKLRWSSYHKPIP